MTGQGFGGQDITWDVDPVAGPLCAYWGEDGEDAPMCGHASCYRIADGE